jgi:hypothetical protein
MRLPDSLVLVAVIIACVLATTCIAGPFNPILPSTFSSFAAATGESVVRNAGASAGVIGGQVEGIGRTYHIYNITFYAKTMLFTHLRLS